MAVFSLQSCLDYDNPTDDFKPSDIKTEDVVLHGKADSINYRDLQITESQLNQVAKRLDTYFSEAKTGEYYMRGGKNGTYPVSHAYQRQYTLADVYSYYGVIPHYDFAYASSIQSSYNVSDDWNNGANGQFVAGKNCMVPLLNHPSIDSIPELKAINLLLFDYSCIEMADLYGPFPYSDYKANKTEAPFTYNKVEDIYESVEANIDTIVNCLNYYDNRPEWYKTKVQELLNKKTDCTRDQQNGITGFDTWKRFANSLKLRMAMHIVKADPEKARKWAEEAVAAGVIESHKNEVGFYPLDGGFTHPLVEICSSWNDMRISASLESLLNSLQHPYLKMMLFTKNSDALNDMAANTKVVGIRSGVHVGQGQSYGSNAFIGYSMVNKTFIAQAPLYLMKWSEVDFLRAEGALRGWNMGGKAEDFYYRGIDNSAVFDPTSKFTAPVAKLFKTYEAQDAPTAYTYHDPLGNSEDMQSVTKIGVKWDDNDSKETKLEKIITQKYIAGYPYSFEAWTDMRRTGYPKMFPVLNVGDGDGSLQQGQLVRRMLFPNTDDSSLRDIQATGLQALGGADKQATRIWWDKDAPNF